MGIFLNRPKASYSEKKKTKKDLDVSFPYTSDKKEIEIDEDMSMEELSDLISEKLFRIFIKEEDSEEKELEAG